MSAMPARPGPAAESSPDVLRFADCRRDALRALLARYGITLVRSEADRDIPGSYWGEEEAGLVGNRLLARDDTPVHSILHEACHYICLDETRRQGLHTDAGGDDLEECAVCYLQIVLADRLPGCGAKRMMEDMDRWGYSFRLGSASAWFEADADDALAWLQSHGLLDRSHKPTFQTRGAA